MTYDPHTDYGPRWVDPSDLHSRICRLEAQRNAERRRAEAAEARAVQAEAELERIDHGICHALLHDLRGGRVGLPLLLRGLFPGVIA